MNITKFLINNNWLAILLLTFTIQSNVFGTTIIVGTPPKKTEPKSMFEPDSDSGCSQTDLDRASNTSASESEEFYIPNAQTQDIKEPKIHKTVCRKRPFRLTPINSWQPEKKQKTEDDGYDADDESSKNESCVSESIEEYCEYETISNTTDGETTDEEEK